MTVEVLTDQFSKSETAPAKKNEEPVVYIFSICEREIVLMSFMWRIASVDSVAQVARVTTLSKLAARRFQMMAAIKALKRLLLQH